jgi:hypothetical protein
VSNFAWGMRLFWPLPGVTLGRRLKALGLESRRLATRADESVANSGLRDQVAWVGGGLELAAKLGHVDAEVVGLGVVGRSPDLPEQLPLEDELSLVPDQGFQRMPLGRRESDGRAVGARFLGCQVDREAGSLDERRIGVGPASPSCGAQPREQLLHAERLGDVVVRAGVQRADLVALPLPGREDDDRCLAPAAEAFD